MIILIPKCLIYGKTFSPKAVEEEISVTFKVKNEPNEIGTVGKYIGNPTPYGSATLQASDETIRSNGALKDFLVLLEEKASIFVKHGATDICLDLVVFHDGQCNIEFSVDEIYRISELKIPVTMSIFNDVETVNKFKIEST